MSYYTRFIDVSCRKTVWNKGFLVQLKVPISSIYGLHKASFYWYGIKKVTYGGGIYLFYKVPATFISIIIWFQFRLKNEDS